jgi:DNA (cytosine-5)-methyltransferase 3A
MQSKKGLNVLSVFDGMSCGQIALERAGIKYDNYFASEIDKHAIKVTMANYPNTIQIGSVTEVKAENLPKIDLLIGGSPCQGFSFAGKQLNFEDERSKLFFEFVRLLRECKPKYFLLENVKMKKEYQDVITEHLGVEPIEINSALVSAQNRKRLYWTNIPEVTQPEDREVMLKDIVHEYVDAIEFEELAEYIVPFDKTLQILDKEVQRGKVGYFRKDSQANRVYYIHDKAVTLCGEAGGGAAKMWQYLFGHTKKNSQGNRVYAEEEKSACLNASSGGTAGAGNILFGCITPDRINKGQNGQRFNEGKKFYTLTAQDKHGILIEGYIRKLTPIECERLQTVPDNYTDCVSKTQRYKMLGNGFTVDVIAHILRGIKET